tara:strand:+ start:113 stop:334 length:222 start_codon:yes stop_codon:yes gene_type:complete
MKKEKKTTTEEQLTKMLEKEALRFSQEGTGLANVFRKLSKHGHMEKSQYSFPLADTIGRNFHEQTRFSVSDVD